MGRRIDKKRSVILGYSYSSPMGIWLSIFFVVPLSIIVAYSFMKKGLYGGVINEFSIKAYKDIFNPNFLSTVWRTLWISVLSTAICILISIPCSYAMARSKRQTLLLALVIIPFWTNSLIRIYAWINFLSTEGFFNNLLMSLGIISEPLSLIYNHFSVILVLIYMYLPFAILPIFTVIDKFDFSLLDAARDLGATKFMSFIKVMIPNIKSGITTALVFTFIPMFGAYEVPLLVGGMDSAMVGNIIVDQVQKTRNWPLAASFSVILTIVSMIGVIWVMRTSRNEVKMKKDNKIAEETFKKEAKV
ncbi:MAG: ABC transporter permease [Spirochaetales bacterium]|nr:ABC transporter permease [Spirochaetales bacterium]